MPDPVPVNGRGPGREPAADPVHAVARELLGILPFGARPAALARCPTLLARVRGGPEPGRGSADGSGAVEAAIEQVGPVTVRRHPEPLAPGLVRRMLHVLLATRDLGWPGTDAPLGVRRVAAADLFFDATQTVLADDDWKGPHGVEFALLTALAAQLCHTPPPGWGPRPGGPGADRLGHLRRARRPGAP